MGYFPGEMISSGAHVLLHRLNECGDKRIAYSQFYDGTQATADQLMKDLSFEDDFYSSELAMDLAAWQLENKGLITITYREARLADGEHDYVMTLTAAGQAFCSERRIFKCHGVDC